MLPPPLALLIAVTLFGLSHSVVARLAQLGAALGGAHNPVSFCNVLFAGNVVAGLALALYLRQDLKPGCWAKVGPRERRALLLVGALSGALAPALLFMALAQTSVSDVVVIGRLQAPVLLAISALLFGLRPPLGVILGEGLILLGVALMLFIDSWGLLKPGQLMAAGGAVSLAVGTAVGQRTLSHVPRGVVMVSRTFIGAVVFFAVAMGLYGPQHFAELGSPFLWKWMLLYGGLIVAVGQLTWARGLQGTPPGLAAILEAFLPIVGIAGAAVIMGEHPTGGQLLGGGVAVLGIGLGALTWWRLRKKLAPGGMGFRGV
ncbi:MAG: EamA family transporter [Alphaproteobacteria bacterium]|nr:EamA family transporter [Alphaproteobacteria bacterium]